MKFLTVIFCLAFALTSVVAQQSESDRRSNTPVEPFKIVENVYYVGAAEVTSFLITTPNGHILIDSGFLETVPQITANVAKLGFKVEDIKYLLNTQAHSDHAGGLAELKRLTGAGMVASAADKVLLGDGGKGDFAFGDTFLYEPVKVDKVIADGSKLKLGGVTLKAILMPGHTKGSTAWTLDIKSNGRKLNVLFFSSVTSPTFRFYGNKLYPTIIEDFEKTFTKVKKLRPDIFLASHGSFFDLLEKIEKMHKNPGSNPFIENESYQTYLKDTEKDFREKLIKQKAELAKPNSPVLLTIR